MELRQREGMTGNPLIAILLELAPEIASINACDCPAVIGALEQLKAQAWTRMMNGAGEAKPEAKLTMQQVAERLNVATSCAYELARQGKIKSIKVGTYKRVTESALKEYEASIGVKSA